MQREKDERTQHAEGGGDNYKRSWIDTEHSAIFPIKADVMPHFLSGHVHIEFLSLNKGRSLSSDFIMKTPFNMRLGKRTNIYAIFFHKNAKSNLLMEFYGILRNIMMRLACFADKVASIQMLWREFVKFDTKNFICQMQSVHLVLG